MIELYTWTTPNGEKPVIMLEECDVTYDLHLVDIGADEQHAPRFRAINPNGKIPALVDRSRGGFTQPVFESGAILIYLAELSGRLLPQSPRARAECFSWTFFQVGNTGPMLGQFHHFKSAAPEKIDYALGRYRDESLRLLKVMDEHLKTRQYLAGDYSIADIINWSWVRTGLNELADDGAAEFHALKDWADTIGARPAVKRGLDRLKSAKDARTNQTAAA